MMAKRLASLVVVCHSAAAVEAVAAAAALPTGATAAGAARPVRQLFLVGLEFNQRKTSVASGNNNNDDDVDEDNDNDNNTRSTPYVMKDPAVQNTRLA